jgi:hypothetical protein
VRRDFGIGSVVTDSINVDLPLHKRSSLTLAEAREKARIGRELAKAGISPSAYWRQEEERPAVTFEQAARARHVEIRKGWRNGKHGDQWLTTLETYAFPELGSKPVEDIDASAIQKVLLPIWLSKVETAAALSNVSAWCWTIPTLRAGARLKRPCGPSISSCVLSSRRRSRTLPRCPMRMFRRSSPSCGPVTSRHVHVNEGGQAVIAHTVNGGRG